MSSVEVKSFANADEINDNFNNAKIAVQSTGMATDAVILEAVDMTEIVSKAGTALGSYSKPGA